MMDIALALSIIIGLLLGLLGGGGSILTVPMLVYVLHIEPKTAILTSFVVVGLSSLIGIIQHARQGKVCWKTGVWFGLAGMLGAFSGGRLAGHLPSAILMATFGVVTLATGLAMLRGRGASTAHLDAADGVTRSACPRQIAHSRLLFDGFFVGAVTGVVGVGGGFLIVPALTLLVGLSMPAAVGTSLLVIVMNAVAGLAGYVNHATLDLPLTAVVTGGAILGSLIGGWLSGRIAARQLRQIFGIFVVLIAGYVLYHSLTVELLETFRAELDRHREFVLGILAAGAAVALARIASLLHRSDRGGKPRKISKMPNPERRAGEPPAKQERKRHGTEHRRQATTTAIR